VFEALRIDVEALAALTEQRLGELEFLLVCA
jgi:hypothetical protein